MIQGKKLLAAMALMAASSMAIAGGPTTTSEHQNFDGFYIGANVGAALYDTSWIDRDAWVDNFGTDWALGTVNNRFWGFNGGLQTGYNHRDGDTVVGVEADGSAGGLDQTKTYRPVVTAGATTLTLKNGVSAFGSVRFRGGIVADNFMLFYLTAGPAVGVVDHNWEITDSSFATEQSHQRRTVWGAAGGAGLEWAVTDNVSVKAEEVYFGFGQKSTSFLSTSGAQTVSVDTQDSLWVSRVGVNYNFNA